MSDRRTLTTLDDLGEEIHDLREVLIQHIRDETENAALLRAAIPANPDGSPDVQGHHDYHAALIEEARDRAKFFRNLRFRLMEGGIFALLGALGMLFAFWWSNGHPLPPR